MQALSTRTVVGAAAFSNAFAAPHQVRNMATLKEISTRLKSVSNIAKITKSMKMIASTKVNKAQKIMETARVYGVTTNDFYKHAEIPTARGDKHLIVVCSSDRGLCGGIHSSVSKSTKKIMIEDPTASLVILGQKAKSQLSKDNRSSITSTFDQITKVMPTWTEAALIGDEILSSNSGFTSGSIVFNQFKSVIAFDTVSKPFHNAESIAAAPKLSAYEIEGDTLKNFEEFALANTIFWGLAEGYASEMTAKRTAMENASKNADEMIQKLNLTYNRSRQASITNDLIDIITGASAM